MSKLPPVPSSGWVGVAAAYVAKTRARHVIMTHPGSRNHALIDALQQLPLYTPPRANKHNMPRGEGCGPALVLIDNLPGCCVAEVYYLHPDTNIGDYGPAFLIGAEFMERRYYTFQAAIA